MDMLFLLLALTMIGAVLVVFLRRMRAGAQAVGGFSAATDPQRYGFAPVDQLDVRLPGPDEELTGALDELARTQDWRHAQRLLAATADHELRWQRVQSLAGAASHELAERPGEGGRWLRSWRVEAPKDAGAAVVHAEFLVHQARQTAAVSGAGSDEHRIILEEARSVCADAALLAPGDPTPYIVELAVARGLGYRQADFEELWSTVTARAPHHMGAHLAALHYWCEKWHGSKELADAFAHRAAAAAPERSLLPALPLFAVFEHLPEVNTVRSLYRSDVVTKAVEGALYAVRGAPADHPVMPHVRHLLVWFLVRAERWADAMEQLAHVDGHVGAVPWSYGANPAAEYAAHRAMAVAGWESSGGTPATMPH
ncbi:hypothetical protein DMH02_018905 [Streptomyces sp. WAC 00631]|uniref:hypothetical protein n=1 Tax=Streptomyces sp. WAC 00631 TaxID=2203201 RepID=UPI000F77A7D9|nr:hypothetical protein [Streptomyces sp. WAC 00631]MCC5035226.1 hypothetical protein [Streptomyces sp. WAC 00631]